MPPFPPRNPVTAPRTSGRPRARFRTSSRLLLALSLAALLAGCAPPKTLVLGDDFASPDRALRTLRDNAPPEAILAGVSRVAAVTADGRYSLKAAVMMKRPSSLRIEEIPLMGLPDLFLAVHGDALRAFFPREGQFYIGRPSKENVARFLPWLLEVRDLLALLHGLPPEGLAAGAAREGKLDGELYRIDARGGALWIDPAGIHLARVEVLDESGRLLYDVALSDYGAGDHPAVPMRLVFHFGRPPKLTLDIRHSDMRVAPEQEEGAFDLPVPAGVTPRYLD